MVHPRFRLMAAGLAATTLLAACETRREPAPVVFRGTQPGVAATAPAQQPAPGVPTPDANGIIDFGGYRAIIARPGDTVESLGARAGLSGSALAAYNGFPSGFTPRAGQEVILPPDAPASSAPAGTIAAAPLEAPAAAPGDPAEPFDLARIEQAIDAPTPATPAPATPTPAAPQAVAPLAPVAPQAISPPAQPAPAPAAAPQAPAEGPAQRVAAAPAAPAAGSAFVRPVSGEVVRPFGGSSGARSDGMEFAAPAGTEVVAAAPGQVALVSEALGGDLGTVILVRHADQVLTVYGRVNSQVTQGERVRAGQVIGTVAPAPGGGRDSLHFEVRRGTDPVDPAQFIGG